MNCNGMECVCCAMSQWVWQSVQYTHSQLALHGCSQQTPHHTPSTVRESAPRTHSRSKWNGPPPQLLLLFFAALRQFPFYLYPNRGHSGLLTVFIDLFAFAIIYVCDCFSFCFFSVFALLVCFISIVPLFSFALSAHCCCGCNRYIFAFFVSHSRLQCRCIACICNSFVQKC